MIYNNPTPNPPTNRFLCVRCFCKLVEVHVLLVLFSQIQLLKPKRLRCPTTTVNYEDYERNPIWWFIRPTILCASEEPGKVLEIFFRLGEVKEIPLHVVNPFSAQKTLYFSDFTQKTNTTIYTLCLLTQQVITPLK